MPAPISSPAMNTTGGGLAPRAHGRLYAGQRRPVSKQVLSPLATKLGDGN